MRTTTRKRVSLVLVAALAILMAAVTGLSVSGVTYAIDGTVMPVDEIAVGHMSDIHYFPLEYCYTKDVDSDEYKKTDFYHSMTGDTKLVLESGTALNSTIQQFIEDGKKNTAPQYVVASGDLSKNGERGALIDVANALRYLQNSMRALGGKYENFQVFAIVGNHDLYNHNGAFYSKEDGHSIMADMVTSMQFAMIFAGLGFPDASLDGANGTFNLTDYMPVEYWGSSFTSGYVTSTNAKNLAIEYYSEPLQRIASESGLTSKQKLEEYFNVGDSLNRLTYFASLTDKDGYSFAIIDSADREESDAGSPVRISQDEYNNFAAKGNAPKLYLDNGEGVIDFNRQIPADSAFTQNGKNVYRRTPVQHITGGRITTECLDWVETRISKQNTTAPLGEETVISSFHHNVLPHFEQEDDILKDFTLYNWEYTAKRFLDMGIRYALTGHMHASDIMTYTDVEGRTLYDYETGSTISYASPRRYVTFTRNDCDGKLGEQATSSVHILENLKQVASNNIVYSEPWNQNAYDAAISAYKANPNDANWQNVINSNPDYLVYIIRYDEFAKLGENNYNDFISKDIYTIIVDRMVDHFIADRTIEDLKETASAAILSLSSYDTVLSALTINAEILNGAAMYIIDTALNDLYGESGYPYNGNTYPDAISYVRAIIDDILSLEYGNADVASSVNPNNKGKLSVREIASFILMSHSAGVEISLDETVESIDAKFAEVACGEDEYRFKQPTDKTYRKRMLYAIKDFDEQLRNGKVVDVLLSSILDPLFNNEDSLLKTLLNYEFNFADAVTKGYLTEQQFSNLEYALGEGLNSKFIKNLIIKFASSFGAEFPSDIELVYDAEKLSLNGVLNDLIPALKPIIANLMGFNMVGDSLESILSNVLGDYVTPSFLVGLGGIASNIVMAFATDVYPDLADGTNPALPYLVQPHKGYKYANVAMSYISANNKMSEVGADFNAATQTNGRVPSRVTANFDTVDSTGTFTVKFYTEENVYGTFRYKTSENGEWITVSTSKDGIDANKDYIDSVATSTNDGITVNMLTQTKPVYLPLIDLGLLCLTHAEIEIDKVLEDGTTVKDVPIIYGERDSAAKNSVVYWNVTTVTVSGLEAGTTYYYDIAGNYDAEDGNTHYFSFSQFNKTLGYEKDYFTFTTAADDSVTSFEFLTIADIQGMIQGMYNDSFAAVKALLADERTKDFDFILNAGDMCDNGKNFNQWSQSLDTYQTLFANTSMFFAAGNHESGSNALANFFNYTLPSDENGDRLQKDVTDGMFFSFNYANAHFVVLNTNDATSNGLGEVQLEWLKKDLAESNAKWKFVLMHKSIYSGGSHSTDSEVVAMRNQLVPIFAQNGVNIVFGGHDHTYTTTKLIDANGKAHDRSDLNGLQYTGDGVLYITLGTMGTKFYSYKDNPSVSSKFDTDKSMLHTLDSQTFGKVKVDGDTITFTGYYYNSETDKIEVIGGNTLSANDILDKNVVIAISVVIPVVVIASVVVTLLILKKKGKLGGKKQ